MQNSFHRRHMATAFLLLTYWGGSTAILADPYANDLGGRASDLRLFASDDFHQDIYHAAIQITLKPGALTYWRQPGDAGVPPVFSFEGSDNLASAEVLYPAPTRIREDEGEAFGYQEKVVFPVHVTPRDKTRPVTLKLTADYAVCEKICIPAKSKSEIILPSAQNASEDAKVAAAEARVPRRLTNAEIAERLAIEPGKNPAHPSWLLRWKDKGPAIDLFAEAPEGWYFETKTADHPNEFTIVAVEMPKTAGDAPIPITLTLTSAHQNVEFTLPLDIANAAH